MKKHTRFGGSLGAGLGLLALLITIAITMYLWSTMAQTVVTGTTSQPSNILKDTRQKTDSWSEQNQNRARDLGLEPTTQP